jgi:hypothetical protein
VQVACAYPERLLDQLQEDATVRIVPEKSRAVIASDDQVLGNTWDVDAGKSSHAPSTRGTAKRQTEKGTGSKTNPTPFVRVRNSRFARP